MIKQRFLMAVLVLLISTTISAQSKQETAVSNAVEKLRTAMVSGERATLDAIAAEQLSYGHSSGLIETKAQFVEKIASGQSDFVSIEFKNQTISISKNTAIVRHELHAVTNDNNKPGEVHLKILLIWQKQGKEWKLLARQAVRITP
ncbi:nuclear transport factor 2 family protein [Lacibacter sp. H407]|uniref:nuclear transport factor 2 family protein n=1 Tax=Lacibacter sp. H407 TaxID=3133423 RepID=UPI0030BE1C6B